MSEITVIVEAIAGSDFTHEPRAPLPGASWAGRPLRGCPVGTGYVAGTLGEDADPVRALVLLNDTAQPGEGVRARPVALLHGERDDRAADEVVCVDADDHDFDQLTGPPDLDDWHARPEHLAAVLDRVDRGHHWHSTGTEGQGAAEELLARAHRSYERLTGCLD
ncbi:inorganic diphosphatase [Kitasatospora sp. NPDC098652]|uniref:inorganic diphosphatase n=1 Tax=Kitasatospora sp. NPDC098652 TaxID=3364095 RepID=UPI00381F9881